MDPIWSEVKHQVKQAHVKHLCQDHRLILETTVARELAIWTVSYLFILKFFSLKLVFYYETCLYLDDEKCRKYTSDEVDRKVTSTLEEYIQNKDLSVSKIRKKNLSYNNKNKY